MLLHRMPFATEAIAQYCASSTSRRLETISCLRPEVRFTPGGVGVSRGRFGGAACPFMVYFTLLYFLHRLRGALFAFPSGLPAHIPA